MGIRPLKPLMVEKGSQQGKIGISNSPSAPVGFCLVFTLPFPARRRRGGRSGATTTTTTPRHGEPSAGASESEDEARGEEGRRSAARRGGSVPGGGGGEALGAEVEHVDDEDGEGGGVLRLHPPRHRHRHELRPQALHRTAPLPAVIPLRPPLDSASAFLGLCYMIVLTA